MSKETLLGILAAIASGTWLGYFILPRRLKVKLEEKIRDELYERVRHLEDLVQKQNLELRAYATELGQLRSEVAECRKLHGKT